MRIIVFYLYLTNLELNIIISLVDLQKGRITMIYQRRKIFDDQISDRAKEVFEYMAPDYNIKLRKWNYDKDHIHILFKAHPNTGISKFISAYKSESSKLLKQEFPQIRQKLWEDYFWSQSFCLLTAGGASVEIIKNYIESQGENR